MAWRPGLLILALLLTPVLAAGVHARSPGLISSPVPVLPMPLPSQLSVHADERQAWPHLAEAERALLLAYQEGGQRFGWTPGFAVPVYLVASGDGLVSSLERNSGMPREEAERYRPLNGAFRFVWQGDRVEAGIHLNVARLAAPGAVTRAIAHEYVHLMQWDVIRHQANEGVRFPVWFLEGMADYYATQITGIEASYLTNAAIGDARAGHVLPLGNLETEEDWARHTRSVGDQNSAYGVAASAVATIEQVGGAGASLRLLRAHHLGLDQFSASLQQAIGLDLAGLQRRLLDDLLRAV